MDLTDYSEAVAAYAASHNNYLFHNRGNEHALIIFSNIYRNAKSTIRIAANSLCNTDLVDKYEYISAVKCFLDKPNTKLRMILSHMDESQMNSSLFFFTLFTHEAYKEDRIDIRYGNGKEFRKGGKTIHFCTVDSNMYRIEDDIQNRCARCNFGDESTTVKLENIFDAAFESLPQIHLDQIFAE